MTGKKSPEQRRREQISAWVTVEEKEKLTAEAIAKNLSVSQYIRDFVLNLCQDKS